MNAASPRKSRRFVLLGSRTSVAFAAAFLAVVGPSRADQDAAPGMSDAELARRAKVAVTVGSRKLTVGEVEDRIAGIPPFQLATYGFTKETQVRGYVDQVLVHDLVLAAGAEERGIDKVLPTKHQLERALSTATLRKSKSAFPAAAMIPMSDVQRYYDENRSRFDSPERINVWRILVKSKDEATTILEAAKRDATITKWNDLARDKSIDKATNMRGGNLGFLAPDGTSNEAGVKVDPGIVKAAQSVKDGEFPAVFPEGENFAVAWRRGTVAANKRSVEESAAQIRNALFRERNEAAEKKLIEGLRAKNVKEVHPELLGQIELRPFDAGLSLPRAIPVPSGGLRSGSPAPGSPPPPSGK